MIQKVEVIGTPMDIDCYNCILPPLYNYKHICKACIKRRKENIE